MVRHDRPGRAGESALPVDELRHVLTGADIMPTLEINCHLMGTGYLADGRRPLDLLESYLPFITALGCAHVHLHATAGHSFDEPHVSRVEDGLIAQFAEGVARAADHGFRLGFEHNAYGEPYGLIFAHPGRCADAIAAVDGLGFVWDFNHTHPDVIEGFMALAPYVTLAHVSDTPLPAVNHHLPLGKGTIDLPRYCAALRNANFTGAMILEIGGLPGYGGLGQDRDEALRDSRHRLSQAWNSSS